ncbi:MAG: ABC transporter permease [Nitrospiraceae bacterium]
MAVASKRLWASALGSLVLGFLYAPIVVLILFSFNDGRTVSSWHGWTIKWYAALMQDRALWDAAVVTLKVALASTAMATVLGVMGAVALERGRHPWLELLLVLPLVIPEVMMGIAFMLLFVVVKLPLGIITVTLAHTAFNAPVVMIVVRSRLRRLDPVLDEAALDLGASVWQSFCRITLPLLMPGIVSGALLAFTISIDDFLVTFFTTGPGGTTLPMRVYSMIRSGVTPEINALSSLLVLISITLVAAALSQQRRETVR